MNNILENPKENINLDNNLCVAYITAITDIPQKLADINNVLCDIADLLNILVNKYEKQ